mmetsp:Transcript_52497/g.152875  ORF Transcript_52497/g.152875 Transcript_52497/m.152875 type:complete len:201 (+) Transcript_52497:169-771(+)
MVRWLRFGASACPRARRIGACPGTTAKRSAHSLERQARRTSRKWAHLEAPSRRRATAKRRGRTARSPRSCVAAASPRTATKRPPPLGRRHRPTLLRPRPARPGGRPPAASLLSTAPATGTPTASTSRGPRWARGQRRLPEARRRGVLGPAGQCRKIVRSRPGCPGHLAPCAPGATCSRGRKTPRSRPARERRRPSWPRPS